MAYWYAVRHSCQRSVRGEAARSPDGLRGWTFSTASNHDGRARGCI